MSIPGCVHYVVGRNVVLSDGIADVGKCHALTTQNARRVGTTSNFSAERWNIPRASFALLG